MPAYHLKACGFLKHNFGFEDMVMPSVSTLTKLINNQFKDFFSSNHVKYNCEKDCVTETVYNVHSIHDYSSNHDFMQEHDGVREKLTRRILRVSDALNGEEPVILIRYLRDPLYFNVDEINDLLNTIKSKYPCLVFYLFIVFDRRNMPGFSSTTNEKNVFYLPYENTLYYRVKYKIFRKLKCKFTRDYIMKHQWKGDGRVWKKIFTKINKIIY